MREILRVHGQKGAGHWRGRVTRLGWLGPAPHPQASWPSPKKILKKISFKKICDFPQIFYCILKYWFVFLYCKNTNPVLKYLVSVKIKK
jgi:hypothetical protein